jgi:hypothetical protein
MLVNRNENGFESHGGLRFGERGDFAQFCARRRRALGTWWLSSIMQTGCLTLLRDKSRIEIPQRGSLLPY